MNYTEINRQRGREKKKEEKRGEERKKLNRNNRRINETNTPAQNQQKQKKETENHARFREFESIIQRTKSYFNIEKKREGSKSKWKEGKGK